jgi:hypothetical protein
MKRNIISQCTQTEELIRRKANRKEIKRTSLPSSKYDFPAGRQDIQYETAQRQVERRHPGVPAKPYSGLRGGMVDWTAVYHQRKNLVRAHKGRITEATLLHSSRGGGVEGMMNTYSGGSMS